MHLESLREQSVRPAAGRVRRFATGERIHTENSYKYDAADFEALLRAAGFADVRRWCEPATTATSSSTRPELGAHAPVAT